MQTAANSAAIADDALILGIDFGTSGLRAHLVRQHQTLASYQSPISLPQRTGQHSQQATAVWQAGLQNLLAQLQQHGWSGQVEHIIADATSSTVLLDSAADYALMYDDRRAQSQAQRIAAIAPANSGAQGASSTLAKVMWLEQQHRPGRIVHQIDWLNQQLCAQPVATDENNALKLGYDAQSRRWPDWLSALITSPLPTVVPAGTVIGEISPALCRHWGFRPHTPIYSGTTDSIAAFLASGARHNGEAVSALGSTLAIKLLSAKPIFASEYGLYSHRLGDQWLIGGASNTGGAVLLHHFSLPQLHQLLPQLNLQQPTGLACYPLIHPGERFPIADAHLAPILPNTQDKRLFLQALIEGLVEVEKLAYQRLHQLGAPALRQIYSVGGGTQNHPWMQLRQARLPAPLANADSQAAAFGVTRLLR
jgi:xylulokinase